MKILCPPELSKKTIGSFLNEKSVSKFYLYTPSPHKQGETFHQNLNHG